MKTRCFVVAVAIVLVGSASALAQEQPRIIARSATVDRPRAEVFGTLKNYLSDPVLSGFTLTSADETTGILRARRSGIDSGTWNKWAFCEARNVEMIYNFESSSAEIEAKVQPSGKDASYVSVRSDLRGTYSLGSASTTIGCVSRGIVENEILTVAGAQPAGCRN